jgi:hypothetical protein
VFRQARHLDHKGFSGKALCFEEVLRLVDSDPDAEWEVWYQDTFDRECPRQVEVSGRGLAAGLAELWARHLFETVRADGGKGFSRFNLWWKQERKSVEVVGEWGGMVRLRAWIFGGKRRLSKGYVEEAEKRLLMRLATVHSYLILAGQTSERILGAAQDAVNREDFERQLLSLEQDASALEPD